MGKAPSKPSRTADALARALPAKPQPKGETVVKNALLAKAVRELSRKK